jgi:ribonucleotide reductase beta subunit family protein with ferritin-like domain
MESQSLTSVEIVTVESLMVTKPSVESEELLTETKNRFVIYPIKYDKIWKMFKIAESSFWTAEEIDLSRDIDDWNKLSDNERYFIKNILAFFAASDGIVNENLAGRFFNEVKIAEAKAFYGFQIAMEIIHSEMYSLMIDTFIKDTEEKNVLFNAMDTIPCIQEKAQWALKWIEDKDTIFAKRLIAFAVVEGIFFSGAFCSIFWLKERGLMPGLCTSNEFISRDEGLHCEFAVLLYSMIKNRLSQQDVFDLINEAVNIEIKFITDSIPCNLLGMNANLMEEYIKFCADRLIVQLGYERLYNAKNPFPFMDRINLEHKTNFFENRESNYSKAKVGQTNVYEFSINEEF